MTETLSCSKRNVQILTAHWRPQNWKQSSTNDYQMKNEKCISRCKCADVISSLQMSGVGPLSFHSFGSLCLSIHLVPSSTVLMAPSFTALAFIIFWAAGKTDTKKKHFTLSQSVIEKIQLLHIYTFLTLKKSIS